MKSYDNMLEALIQFTVEVYGFESYKELLLYLDTGELAFLFSTGNS